MVTDATAPDDLAPAFSLPNTHGGDVSLRAFTGRPVALLFFPFAFTTVCTGELRDLSAGYTAVRGAGAEVLAISTDTRYALRVFADREGFAFPLLSDFWPHGEVARDFGAFDAERGCAVRASFVLDAAQRVVWTDRSGIGTARDISAQLRVLAG